MKLINSFKLLHPSHKYPTMYSKIDDGRFFKTILDDNAIMNHIEITLTEYASAYANLLTLNLNDDTTHVKPIE
jgi:hypothetical protein